MSNHIEDIQDIQGMGELLDSVGPMRDLKRGDIVEGVVMRSDSDGILVNIGHKAEGLVPTMEMKTVSREGSEPLKIGDEVVACVIKGDSEEGSVILSIDQAVGERGWKTLAKALESGETLEGEIIGFNKGGSVVEVENVNCFVPVSQLVSVPRDYFRQLRDDNPAESGASSDQANDQRPEPTEPPDIGKKLELKVLEVNRSRNRAILSERQALQEQREVQKAKLLEELKEGEVRKGVITGISNFGAFVDLGGADGLIHISELSWNPVDKPEDIVSPGQAVDVYVLSVDGATKRIGLSLKRLQQEPWATINEKLTVGEIVEVTVTKLIEFGAFARIEGLVEGLIHISELSSKNVNHPREVVSEGQIVRVKVLRIEPERRRLAMSLRQALDDEGIVYSEYQ